ncbi:hypothetical protein ACP70R_009356 [Stipagrostis hirtigluma subsp. patula]
MASFRIRSTSTVTLPAGVVISEPLPLSAFDSLWVTQPPLLNIFMFPPTTPAMPFPLLVDSLKSSLSRTLPSFHPFAGELTYLPSSQSVAIVCRDDGPGATFVEAETDVDFQRLVEANELDDEVLRQLVPDIWWDALPAAPLLAVQATEFVGGGGVAVGLACHHAVVDGHGLIQFMQTWAAAAARSGPDPPTPLHDRRLVRFDGDEEFTRSTLRRMAPNLPSIAAPNNQDSGAEHRRPLIRQTFTFTAAAVRHLKRLLTPANAGEAPSTYAAIAAHAWVSFACASGFDDDEQVFLGFPADCRAHMSPPIDPAYAGNCVALCKASLKGSEITAPDGLPRAFMAIREAVSEVKANPLKNMGKNKDKDKGELNRARAFFVPGSPWLPMFEFDLGFGKPVRVERARLQGQEQAYLTAGMKPGSVQAMVVISAGKMQAFREAFKVDGVDGDDHQ